MSKTRRRGAPARPSTGATPGSRSARAVEVDAAARSRACLSIPSRAKPTGWRKRCWPR